MSHITVHELALWCRAGFAFKLLDVRRAQARAADSVTLFDAFAFGSAGP